MIDVTKQGVNIVVNSDDIDILINWCDAHKITYTSKQNLLNNGVGYFWFKDMNITFGELDGYQSATVDEVIHNNNIKKLLTS